MAARPLVTVHDAGGDGAGQAQLPAVFLAPIRPDVVSLTTWVMAQLSQSSCQRIAQHSVRLCWGAS